MAIGFRNSKQRRVAVAVACLLLLAMSGCIFALSPAPVPHVVEPMEGAPLPTMASDVDPSEPSDLNKWMQFILNTNIPYRDLGGVTMYRGKLAMVWPADLHPGLGETERALTRSYAAAVLAERGLQIQAKDCVGTGDLADPIVVLKEVHPKDEVMAGIACARLRFPKSSWAASTLAIGDGRAVSLVLLYRKDGAFGLSRTLQLFHTDVTRFVARHRSVVP